MLHEAANLIRVPFELPFAATAPVELAMCVSATFMVLAKMDVVRGARVGISGLGPAGLIAAQLARAEGAGEVVGFDLSAARREFAAGWCLDAAFDPREVGDRFPARPASPTLETIVDCVGAKASVEWGMDHTSDVMALFGVQREDYTFAVRHYRGLRLLGYPGHSREAAEYAVRRIGEGELNLEPLSTHHLPLERYGEGIDLLERQEAIKICFHPWWGPNGEGETG
jgi:threonine dehydrogenase-like Zn-dependent dehydrogenase